MLDSDFLAEFKRATEAKWSTQSIDPNIYGFQIQRGTRWLPGLSDEKIAEYENFLGVQFPHDLRAFLAAMNGTDLPTLNIYAYCGYPPRESVGVYSYPRDAELIKQQTDAIRDNRAEIQSDLASQGFDLLRESNLVPIYAHRYVVCTPELDSSVVLSIVVNDVDAIVYGDSLQDYLKKEFLTSND